LLPTLHMVQRLKPARCVGTTGLPVNVLNTNDIVCFSALFVWGAFAVLFFV
jgi:hypothetical protein